MAIIRQAEYCPFCGKPLKWISNKLSESQKILGFLGDVGGKFDYQGHYNKCKKYKTYKKNIDKLIKNAKTQDEKNKIIIDEIIKRLNDETNKI